MTVRFATLGSLALAVSLAAAPARADVTTLTDSSGLAFDIEHNTSGTSWSSFSGNASDAGFTTSVTATTSSGGTTMTALSDSFDGYGALTVNGTPIQANGVATMGCTDREVILNDQTVGNLTVGRRIFVPDNDEFARWLNVITNSGSSTENVYVSVNGNLGSDSSTVVTATSSGAGFVTTNDIWVATGGDFSDPRLGHVFSGPASYVSPASVFFANGSDEVAWTYQFDLPAGATAMLVNFVTGQPSNADAAAKAAELATLPANALTCISAAEQAQIINFVVPGGATCNANIDGTPCDDGNVCTTDDVCTAGTCGGTPEMGCYTSKGGCSVGVNPGTGGRAVGPVLLALSLMMVLARRRRRVA